MSEENKNQHTETEEQTPIVPTSDPVAPDSEQNADSNPIAPPAAPIYRYHWNYQTQVAFDQLQSKKKKRHGIFLYAGIMTIAFLLCFAILIGSVFFYSSDGGAFWSTKNALSTSDVFDLVAPATVFIQNLNGSKLIGEGTGFLIRADGYIATNYHVVEKGTQFKVYLSDKKSYVADLVGYDKSNDLAVLKIDGSNFRTITIGNSDEIRIGEPAIAIGCPSGSSGAWSASQGIISALNRSVTTDAGTGYGRQMHMIQFDASVNPGNSGGPLCNASGEVVGIVTLKLRDYEGIGYAIPINQAVPILRNIISSNT